MKSRQKKSASFSDALKFSVLEADQVLL